MVQIIGFPGSHHWRYTMHILWSNLGFLLHWTSPHLSGLSCLSFLLVIDVPIQKWDLPAPKWRRRLSQHLSRLMSFVTCLIFAVIPKYVDHSKKPKHDPRYHSHPPFDWSQSYTLVGNHQSIYDAVIGSGFLGNPSIMARGDFLQAPILGFILKQFRAIPANRNATHDANHKSASQLYLERKENPLPGEYAVCMFPEGTDTNGSAVTRFHKGAFLGGHPVRPFTIKYPGKRMNLAWDTINVISLIWETSCQFYNRFEMHVYDLYYPTEEERNDPELYSQNVGRFVAAQLGVPYKPECDIPHYRIAAKLWDGKMKWNEAVDKLFEINRDQHSFVPIPNSMPDEIV
ncbi:putative Lysophospholipid acyltransferase LPEAT1 [Blattamonas nauphoetae]|uniref:Lysophospholipid acyltransferase LPEAT1 n=1 Tax=Blattamonas nauphoetae TaxID=2049346 RepID=A0ABQ9XD11_9EUKA|nr:putative Lysophospholipid acyltransferase LPEAT1 [Blattamonas nauphoetae]